MESKFIALDKANEEVDRLTNFLEYIELWPKLVGPICIHCDIETPIGNQGIIM